MRLGLEVIKGKKAPAPSLIIMQYKCSYSFDDRGGKHVDGTGGPLSRVVLGFIILK